MRRLLGATVLGTILVASSALSGDRVSADEDEAESAGGLLGGVAERVTDSANDAVSGTLETTRLDEVARVDLRSGDDGEVLGASVEAGSADEPALSVDAGVSSDETALAGVEAGVSAANGDLAEATGSAAVATDEGLAAAEADLSAAEGEVLEASAEVTAVGDDGLLQAEVDASAAGGDLASANVNADVGGASLVALDLDAEVAGQVVTNEADVTPEIPGDAANKPAGSSDPKDSAVAAGAAPRSPAGPAGPERPAATSSQAPAVEPTSALGGAPSVGNMIPRGVRTLPPSEPSTRGGSRRTAAEASVAPTPVVASPLPADLAVSLPVSELSSRTATGDGWPGPAPAGPAQAAVAGGAILFNGFSQQDSGIGAVPASLVTGMALLMLLTRGAVFRSLASRACLPPQPPG